MRSLTAFIVLAPLLLPLPTWSHDGVLDGFGCHAAADRKAYECHRGFLAGQTFASKAEMLHALEGTRPVDGNSVAEVTLHSSRKDPDQVCIRENFTKQVLCGTVLR